MGVTTQRPPMQEAKLMDTHVFDTARQLLTGIYGSLVELESGNGIRCPRAASGKITLYRSSAGLAEGNRGEIAFDVDSHARRAGKDVTETRRFFEELKAVNGRATERNARYNWPRVGFSNEKEVHFIVLRLKQFFGL